MVGVGGRPTTSCYRRRVPDALAACREFLLGLDGNLLSGNAVKRPFRQLGEMVVSLGFFMIFRLIEPPLRSVRSEGWKRRGWRFFPAAGRCSFTTPIPQIAGGTTGRTVRLDSGSLNLICSDSLSFLPPNYIRRGVHARPVPTILTLRRLPVRSPGCETEIAQSLSHFSWSVSAKSRNR